MKKRSKFHEISNSAIGKIHRFDPKECTIVQKNLLGWYDDNKRALPWRTAASTEQDVSKRAYAVWVSEMMLQQTQVATVINYYNRWMEKWPSIDSLASSDLEDVNKIWAGLGYYSRARRLHEGAVKLTSEMEGKFPCDRESLQRELPGVGRYTASALASIAMNQAVGVVDGNVVRVLSRLRGIGADSSLQEVIEFFWELSDNLVPVDRPGDFNQALMELGATVCTPKNTSCSVCPLRKECLAYQKVCSKSVPLKLSSSAAANGKSIRDIECIADCRYCIPKQEWNESLGVQNYPVKSRKTKVNERTSLVLLLQAKQCEENLAEYCVIQRPKNGLLGNLWEFLSLEISKVDFASHPKKRKIEDEKETFPDWAVQKFMNDFSLAIPPKSTPTYVGEVLHIFSHIRQTYKIYKLHLSDKVEICPPPPYQNCRWITKEDFLSSATSTAMKKVFKLYSSHEEGQGKLNQAEVRSSQIDGKQKKISSFFVKRAS